MQFDDMRAAFAHRALLEERQRERCNSVHLAACALRANILTAVTEKTATVQRQRLGAASEVKEEVAELKRQRNEACADWSRHGRAVSARVAATRRGASRARNGVREHNLSEAHRASAERLDMFKQSAEAQSALSEGKRLMAERVRREAGLQVVRSALSRASFERGLEAERLRRSSQNNNVSAELGRIETTQTKQLSASRVELQASPQRLRELKGIEARRKAGLTGALRSQYRAFEVRGAADVLPSLTDTVTRAPPVLASLVPCHARAGSGAREAS